MYLTHPSRRINRIPSLSTLITIAIVIVAVLIFIPFSHAIDSPAKAGASQRLKTIIVNNYHPYTFMNDKGEPDGFSVEIARAVTKVMDLELEIRADKWDVAMKELEAGSIDLLPMMAYSPERYKIFDFSVSHTIAYDAIFIKKGTSGLRSLKDLSGKSVIVMNKDIAHSYLLSSGLSKTMTLNLVDSLPDALKQLSAGKGDAAIMPKLVGIVTAKKLNLSEIETSPQLIDAYTRPFSFAVKNGNQELLERLNQGLNIIKSTGQYDVIYKKWFGALEDPHLDLKTAIKYASGALFIIIVFIAWNVMLNRQVRAKTKHLEVDIAERKQAEEALAESEYRWKFALEGARDGVWDWNIQTGEAFYSGRYKEMLGFAENEIGNTSDEWLKRIHPEDASVVMTALQPYLDGKAGSPRVEFRMLCKDGSWKWIVGRGVVVSRDSAGKPLRIIGTNTDITNRKLEEEQIKSLTQRLLLATSSALLGVWDWNVTENTMVWDDRMFELYGITRDAFPSNIYAWMNGLHPEDKETAIAECQAALKGEKEFDTVFRVLHPDGTVKYLKANALVIRGTDSTAERMIGINTDITEHIRAEAALQEASQLFEMAIAQSPSGILIADAPDVRIRMANPAAFNIRGGNLRNLTGIEVVQHSANWQTFRLDGSPYPPEQLPLSRAVLLGVVTQNEQLIIRDEEGTDHWVNANAAPIRDAAGHIRAGIVIFHDITAIKHAEQSLQHERDITLDLLNASPAGIYRVHIFAPETWKEDAWFNSKNAPYAIELVSDVFCEILGITRETFENNPGILNDLVHPEDKEDFARIHGEAMANPTKFMWEGRLLINGNTRWVYFQSFPRPLENGDVIWTGALMDITDRKLAELAKHELEQQFQHTQKLESLGVLSGGIAHDFNNILAIIIGYCNLTKMDLETAEKNIPEIEKAAERAAGLCRQMLAYAGKAQLTKTQFNMVKKVGEIVGMLKSTLPQNAVINTDLTAEIPLIEGDASQLGQVVMNLIINASEAIGTEHGEVNISLARINVIAGKSYEDYHGKAIPPGEYVCLEVTDDGCGMDEATKWRIFEPFFTTKFTGRGLGMSAVLGIIKSHGGALQLFSQPGQGTTFKVYLPAPTSDTALNEDQTASAPSAQWQGSGTILLVEDEDQVRLIAKMLLKRFGFNVLEAVNGKEALELYQKNAADITLVFTDMGMPVMDGYELFHKLKSLNPELPIIVSSGYGDAEVSSRIGSDNIAGLISKPYNPDKLREVLKRVVG